MPQLLRDLKLQYEEGKVNDYVLYHALSSYKALKILKTDQFILPLSDTNSSEINPLHKKIKTYYLSFARTPSSGYIADRSSGLRVVNETVLFVFNQHKLENLKNVSFSPVDYWGTNSKGRNMGSAKEAEERMFSDVQIISGIIKCLKEVRMFVYSYTSKEPFTHKETEVFNINEHDYNVYSFCKKNKIKITLYSVKNISGFRLGKPEAEDQRRLHKLLAQHATAKSADFRQFDKKKAYTRLYGKQRIRFPDDLLIMVQETKPENLPKEIRSHLVDCLKYGISTDKGYATGAMALSYSYKHEISNIRGSSGYDDKNRRVLARALRLAKAKSMMHLYKFIENKWTPLLG